MAQVNKLYYFTFFKCQILISSSTFRPPPDQHDDDGDDDDRIKTAPQFALCYHTYSYEYLVNSLVATDTIIMQFCQSSQISRSSSSVAPWSRIIYSLNYLHCCCSIRIWFFFGQRGSDGERKRPAFDQQERKATLLIQLF